MPVDPDVAQLLVMLEAVETAAISEQSVDDVRAGYALLGQMTGARAPAT